VLTVCDVGPRDGLQNEPDVLAPVVRADLVTRLAAAGTLPGSFCRPSRGPTSTIFTSFGRFMERPLKIFYHNG
jgi:isopropylmalate/homocitrate/citramalate synthase